MQKIIYLLIAYAVLGVAPAISAPCAPDNKPCIMAELEALLPAIDTPDWRDKAARELAKSYTRAGFEDKALALIDIIENPDTRAMTIRGIGFAAADSKWNDKERYTNLFNSLSEKAQSIDHLPSQGIAWTYIAMAQAMAGENEGASATARAMGNEALRHKAFGENAEIQAARGDIEAAMASIAEIQSTAFRNKAYRIVSSILYENGYMDGAYKAAQAIDNPYTKAQALQVFIEEKEGK